MPVKEVNVVLRGGPAAHFEDDERIRYVSDTENSIKVQRGNRYEHFEPTTELVAHQGRELLVFTWTRVTYVAE